MKLIDKKTKALEFLIEGFDEETIAKKLEVRPYLVKRWFKDPVIKTAFQEVSVEVIEKAKDLLLDSLVDVSKSLIDLALNAKSEMARYRASIFVLKTFGLQPPKVSITMEKKQIVVMRQILGE